MNPLQEWYRGSVHGDIVDIAVDNQESRTTRIRYYKEKYGYIRHICDTATITVKVVR